MRQIIVSSNCQTAGLAAALSAIFPRDQITPLPHSLPADEIAERQLMERVRGADLWVSLGNEALVDKYGVACANPSFRFIKCPALFFDAFHPDLCYARRRPTGAHLEPHYNSVIVAWCYQQRVPEHRVPDLFCKRVFAKLGYLNIWESSIELLRGRFIQAGWESEFDAFFRRIQRTGNFMHSVNHPKSDTLVTLAKVLSTRMGEDWSILDRDVMIADGLADNIWPTYPEIADELGVPSTGYIWRDGLERRGSVEEYVAYAYSNYKGSVAPEDLVIQGREASFLETTLRPDVGP